MLANPTGTIAVSNLGWVDHGAVWRYDVRRANPLSPSSSSSSNRRI
jgi:hypothetical protein